MRNKGSSAADLLLHLLSVSTELPAVLTAVTVELRRGVVLSDETALLLSPSAARL